MSDGHVTGLERSLLLSSHFDKSLLVVLTTTFGGRIVGREAADERTSEFRGLRSVITLTTTRIVTLE